MRPTGRIGVVGVFVPEDPSAADDLAKEGKFGFDFGTFFFKGQSMGASRGDQRPDRSRRDPDRRHLARRARSGHVVDRAGVLSLTVLAVGCIVLGLHALLGKAGLPVAFAALVFLGNAFSGSSSAPELLPPAARRVGQWLPPGAGNELVRSASFFHGHGATHPIVVLGVWVALGSAAILAATS